MGVPNQIRTERLLLRCWRQSDARALRELLLANQSHIGPWIPLRVSEPASIPELERRLSEFAASFDASREWRYGIFSPDESQMFGEVDLLPRRAESRVPYATADRAEIGYWLRADRTGQGLASEAARALLDVAAGLPPLTLVEIRCDARNAASSAVPRRLGFMLSGTSTDESVVPGEPPVTMQIWTYPLRRATAVGE
jgi:RimJ/RimL family protein N-acetyltransferase